MFLDILFKKCFSVNNLRYIPNKYNYLVTIPNKKCIFPLKMIQLKLSYIIRFSKFEFVGSKFVGNDLNIIYLELIGDLISGKKSFLR